MTIPSGTPVAERREDRRDIVIEYETGKPDRWEKYFAITRGRLIVFAVDGLGWDEFHSLRDQTPNLRRLFGSEGSGRAVQGQNVLRQVLTTYTPITFGRWASIFSGALPKATGVPSNEYLNRRTLLDPGGRHGELSQCLGCGTIKHLTDPIYNREAYTHSFQVPLIYDAIEKKDGRRHSVVVAQQAGLGMMNWTGPGLNTWRKWGREMVGMKLGNPAAFDESVRRMAIEELDRAALGKADPKGDFELMVLYFAGLDENLHKGIAKDTRTYITGTLDRLIGEVADHAAARLKNTPIYALVVDHGHTPTERAKHMDLEKLGTLVRLGESGRMPWKDVLTPDEGYVVSKSLVAGNEPANVIFARAGGFAHVYVKTPGTQPPIQGWMIPPSLARLTPLVNNIMAMVAKGGTLPPSSQKAVKDVLVRVPGPESTFASSRYMAVRSDYKRACVGAGDDCERSCGDGMEVCTLANQLIELADLDARSAVGEWQYAEPERRVNTEWASENSGDILMLADMENGYCFDKGELPSTHGSLSYKDARVPLGFSYPGATSGVEAEDDVLKAVRGYLEAKQGRSSCPQMPQLRGTLWSSLWVCVGEVGSAVPATS